jgi:HEAT repeat protein
MLSSSVFRYLTDNRGPKMLYPAMAALALPKYGQTSTAADLIALRWPPSNIRHGGAASVQILRLEPQRGTAAMALGIASNVGGGPGEINVRTAGQDARDVVGSLATYLPLSDESRFTRAAFALGLGLTGDPLNAQPLVTTARQMQMKDNVLLWGHIVLALGLLKDERALDGASVLLSLEKDPRKIRMDTLERNLELKERLDQDLRLFRLDYTLGKRAALLGLAALGDPRAAPMLRGELAGNDPFVAIEAARAMNWCGAYDMSDPLADVVATSTKAPAAAMAALLLGEMYDADRPSKLSRLCAGNYYGNTIFASSAWYGPANAGIQREFHGLGNRFLYFHVLRLTLDPE